MVRPRGQGRSKIEIKKIENKDSLYCTFTKRRNGLFSKAKELSALAGTEVAAIVFSPKDKLYAYGQPSVNIVVDRFLGEQSLHGDETGSSVGGLVHGINGSCPSGQEGQTETQDGYEGDFLGPKKERETATVGRKASDFSSDERIQRLELRELVQCKASLEEFMKKVADRLDEMRTRRTSLKDFLGRNWDENSSSTTQKEV